MMKLIRPCAAIIIYILATNLIFANPPVATNDAYSVNEGNTLTVSAPGVLANDYDLDGVPFPITAVIGSTTSHGSLTLNPNGSFSYTHDGSETTSDAFTYRAFDGLEYSGYATVTITIDPVNDDPVLQTNTGLTVDELGSGTITSSRLLVTDVDNSASQIVFTITNNVDYGVLKRNSTTLTTSSTFTQDDINNNRITYTHSDNEETSDAFTFTVSDGAGGSIGATTFNITINNINDPPTASSVAISGTLETEETLTGTYIYSDPEGNPEGASTFAWYRANNGSGSGAAAISGATSKTYTTVFADGGKYLQFRVTPRDNQGGTGTTAVSDWEYINAAPVASSLSITGVLAVGETVTASFSYSDLESNPAGSHNIIWYRSSTPSGTGTQTTTGVNHTVTSADNANGYIRFTVTPVATTGSSPGQLVESAWVPVTELSTATISGTDTVCLGSSGSLTIDFTGDSPWDIVYKIGSGTGIPINNITDNPYTLSSATTGTYTLVSVEDNNGYSGTVSGSGTIVNYATPTATISGTKSICEGVDDSIAVYLTGTAPWSYSYNRGGGTINVTGVETSPDYIPVSTATAGTYTLTAVNDAHCTGTANGSVEVSVKTSPIVTLSGGGTICPGDDTTLVIQRISGAYPLTVTYARDGISQTPVQVEEEMYNLSVSTAGIYTLVSVSNTEGQGCVSGLAEIDNYTVPTATISGNESFCEGTHVTVPVTLTGSPRFSITYTLGGGSPVTVNNITIPYSLDLNPSGTSSLTLTEVSDQNCPGTASGTISLSQISAPDVQINNLEEIYSSDLTQVSFNYIPISGGDFDDSDESAVIINQGSGNAIFSPAISGSENSPHKVVYKYQAGTGCWGRDSVIISVLDDLGQIDVLSTKKDVYCFNDRLILLRGVNVEKNLGTFEIEGGVGLVDSLNNKATVDPTLIKSGSRTIYYHFEAGGSQETATLDLNFEEMTSDFRWDNECFGDEAVINFEGLGEGDSDPESFYWDFYLPDTTMTEEGEDASFTFDEIGTYQVDYIIESENACRDTATKFFTLRQTIDLQDEAYHENFETGAGQWVAKSLEAGGINSWTLGTPDNSIMHGDANNESWYTDIDNKSQVENSYVVSPCFSFEQLDRPMISMDIWRAFDQRRDGAVLQYSLNDGTGWKNIGQLDDGIEWYNSYQIQGMPGDQAVGWSEDVDNKWKEARHDLNALANKPSIRLRIAYGTDGSGIINEGFAFDDIWIYNRSKKVLLEHFTSAADTTSKNANETVNEAVNSMTQDVIDIQYHIAAPGDDPFYDLNQGISDSREIYYNLEDVPYGIIDGGRGNKAAYMFDYLDHDLSELDLKLAVLEDNSFDIDLKGALTDDAIVIETEIEALDTIPERIITLHHVVLERLIRDETGKNGETRFESVAKDMVPNTFGTVYEKMWLPGETEDVSYIWPFENVYDEDELRVVAFVQDETTKEIYQAAISDLNDDITGTEEIKRGSRNSFTVYPNPSFGDTWIDFGEIINDDLRVEVFDNTSKLIYSKEYDGLTNNVYLPLNNIYPGVYIVRVSSKERIYLTEKLIMVRKK